MRQTIILLGPPGAGKGTQAELLSRKFSLYYFETSEILERTFQEAEEKKKDRIITIEGKKYSVLEEEKIWKEGKLCSPPFVVYLVQEEIKRLFEEGRDLVIGGSPRTVYEAEKIVPVLKNLYGLENIKVVLIEISPEETIFRNSHRRICQLMRHPILYNEETKNLTVCPLDGSKLLRREGLDDLETIKTRLKEYKERTYPVLEVFEEKGLKIRKVNGEQSIADVFKDILKVLK